MVIVCGIDGSANSREAARAAAALAKLDAEVLVLVYVQEALVLGIDALAGATPVALANTAHLDADRQRMHGELEREASRLVADFGIEVRHTIRTGLPDTELVRVAEEEEAELLVVASLGRRAATMWRFGSVADRLSQSSPVPLLVVRDARAFERWAREGRTLAITLALGAGKPTQAAVRAAQGLAKLGTSALTEVHIYDPLEEGRRRGLYDFDAPETRARIEGALARELPPRFGQEKPGEAGRFVALPSRGHVAETLAEFVEEEQTDVLVLGTHRHGALRRRFFGSTSSGVLPMVATNVLVVPTRAAESTAPARPRRVQRVLVATDLSETGNRAVELALGLVPEGCQLVLLHVDVPPDLPSGVIMGYHPSAQTTPAERRMKRALAETELEKLAREGGERSLETEVEVVESSDVSRAILEAAERHEVDLICLGTHHHGRVASALIGSVARSVARRSSRPVLLVPAETGG
jgi:nucleotide-binding universal stress UspA family protein